MSVPKKRVSKARRGMRRSHITQQFAPPSLATCPRCQEPKLAHRVCIHCGYYRDREVIKMDEI